MGGGIRVVALVAALLAWGLSSVVRAQSVTPGELQSAVRQGEQLLRLQQELQEGRQSARERSLQRPSGQALPQVAAPAAVAPPSGKCVKINSLRLIGAHLLSKKEVARLDRQVAGHCIAAGEINAVLRRITDVYLSKGYVTTRAYIPPQNAAAGTLTVVVIEGKVERIEVNPHGSASAATAFPGMVGKVFNLRDAEQGIDQLNRLSSNNARIDIRPGSVPGYSDIEILNSPGRRLRATVSADDTGTAATGLWQGGVALTVDDPLRINDGLLFSYSRNIDGPDQGPAMSRATMVDYSVPYGWWTGELLYTDTGYDTLVQGVTRNFVTSGTDRAYTLRLDRVAYRDQSKKLTVYADLTRRDTENYVAGVRIATASRVLTLVNLRANLSWVQGLTLWSFDAGLSRGVRWLGGFHDPQGLPGDAPHGDYTKAIASAGLSRGFAPRGIRMQLSSTLAGQWSNDVLYPSEQIAIAGPFAVRGYRQVSLYGDRGFTWRNELGFPMAAAPPNAVPMSFRPYIGADYGRVWSHDGLPGGYLSGGTVGMSLAWPRFDVELSWSAALRHSASLPADHYVFARLVANF
jgi:hemolysin activation/secretion protein